MIHALVDVPPQAHEAVANGRAWRDLCAAVTDEPVTILQREVLPGLVEVRLWLHVNAHKMTIPITN